MATQKPIENGGEPSASDCMHLLACPFCSGDPGGVTGDDVARAVGCYCGANGPIHKTDEEAIDAWNMAIPRITAEDAKEKISEILLTAVNGEAPEYRYDNPRKSYVRWGRVERDIHAVIDGMANKCSAEKAGS